MRIAHNCARALFLTFMFVSPMAVERPANGVGRAVEPQSISVTGSRPLARAIESLEQQYRWTITYEDPIYAFAGDTSDVTKAVRRDGRNDQKVLVPRGGLFRTTYFAASESALPDSLIVVRRVVAAYNASGFPGQFRAIRNGSMIHVVPTGAKNYNGILESSGSPFDAKISIPSQVRTVMATVEEIVRAVTTATGIQIGFGVLPDNLLANKRVQIGANRETARDVLAGALAATGYAQSWHLLYNPTESEGAYFLSIHVVRTPER